MATSSSSDGGITGVVWRSSAEGGQAVFDDESGATAPATLARFIPMSPLDGAYGSPSFGAGGANVANLLRFTLERAQYNDRVLLSIGTASGNVDVGIYDDDGTGGAPATRLVSSGSVACPTAGLAAVTIADTLSAPGIYWAAFVFDNATATSIFFNSQYTPKLALTPIAYTQAASFPLPASLSAPVAVAATSNFAGVTVGKS